MQTKKKEFTYRGKTLDELNKLNVREFAQYLDSNSKRHVLRNFHEIEKFLNKIKIKLSRGKKIRTHKREMIIFPELIGKTIYVHNGREFIPVEISKEMIGHKLGEFALTRSKITHSKAGIGATKGTKHKAKK